MKKFLLTHIFLSIAFIACFKELRATHTMGVDMTYECLGPGQYRILLQVYRDCNGIAMVSQHDVYYSSVQCGISNFITVHQVSVEDITPVCDQNPNTACGGTGQYGVEKYTFLGILTLPPGCGNDWELSWELCCRNGAITNLLDPLNETVYIEICLDNTLTPCNNSPFFLNNPIPFYCLNQPVHYNHGVIDVDGDSLVFTAGTSLSNGGVSVAYQPGYSGNAPFNTTTSDPYYVNSITGDISYTPDALQIAVAKIEVAEYRNGVKIGCVVRDMQFTIINCGNILPTVSGINGTDTFNINLTTCSDTCFDIFTNDADVGDNLTLTWNNGIPSGSFTTTNAQHPTGTFCWTPTDLDIGLHYFTVTVQDDHCPIIGTNMRSYIVRVFPGTDPPVNAGPDTVFCSPVPVTLSASVIGGTPTSYTWSDGAATWNTQSISVFPQTTTTYTVTAQYVSGCRKTDAVTITVSNPTVTLNSPTTNVCSPGGPVTLLASTNAAGPVFSWNPGAGFSCTNCPNPTFTPSTSGQYCVSLIDFYNCPSNTACTQVNVNTLMHPVLASTDSADCFGGSNGSAQVTVTGGNAPYQFSLDGINFQSFGTFTGLIANNYVVLIRDALLCDTTLPFTIAQPAQLLTASVSNLSGINCFGGSTASVQVSGSGGTPPYQYSLNGFSFQSSGVFSGLTSGNYTATVRDSKSCVTSYPFSISEPPQLTPGISGTTNVSCFGGNNGSAQISSTGGTTPYQFSINGGSSQTSGSFNNLTANPYTIVVSDANSCSATLQFLITQPAPLSLSVANTTNTGCNGANNGSVQLSATGGAFSYQYSIDGINFQTSGLFTGLSAGAYTGTVRDASNCTISIPFAINSAPALSVSVTGTVNPLCYGVNTGSVQLIGSGGNPPYQFSLDGVNFQTTPAFYSLGVGNYTATVRDSTQCTATVQFNILQPAQLTPFVTNTNHVTCFGNADASLTLNITGGTPNYTARLGTITVSSPPYTFNSLPANNYLITVTDANNCSATVSVVINQPVPLVLSLGSVTPVSCFGGNNGAAFINPSGGTLPYQYSIDGSIPGLNNTFTGLSFGNHWISVTDANQCTASLQINIPQAQPGTFASVTVTDVKCFGSADGAINLTVVGNGNPWTYMWSTGYATEDVSGLSAGYYSVTVIDVNNCSTVLDSIFVDEPLLLSVNTNIQDVSCYGANDGVITAMITGGTPSFTYAWSTGTNGNQLSSAIPGTYSVTVSDANNCSASAQNITVSEPAQLFISTTVVDVSCPGFSDGSISAIVSGGTIPYSYWWNNANGNLALNANIPKGTYSITVTDANNCTVTATDVISELPGIIITGSVSNVLCDPLENGLINISVQTQYPPATYLWSNGATTEDVHSLYSGYYSVTVTDANNCVKDTSFVVENDNSFSITAFPPSSQISLGDSVQLSAAGIGGNIAGIVWEPPVSITCTTCINTMASPVQTIYYTATAISDSGCVASDQVYIVVDANHVVFIPNVFTPDGGSNNDYFEVFGNKEAWSEFEVLVFDRIGEKMYESHDKYFKWDGSYKGKESAPQVFVYLIKVAFKDGYYDFIRKGSVTLLR